MLNFSGKNHKILTKIQLELMEKVHKFHRLGNIFIDDIFEKNIIPYISDHKELQSLERSDHEISPFHSDSLLCKSTKSLNMQRNRSAPRFSAEKIHFPLIMDLLHHSFACKNDFSRPYASGGALYSIEVIGAIFQERLSESIDTGYYHYRPTLHIMQPLKRLSAGELSDVLFRRELSQVNQPNFALIYFMVLNKALIKYRYRGYRYALMEAGSMYHQADLVGKQLGLINKLYSGFNDDEITSHVGLNKINFLPLIIQSFGVAE